jgi:PIN domain nuclease of toxin-antitoxin system
VRLLLDSHTLVWAATEPEKLPARVREAIADGTNELFTSMATIWELANKVAMGRLPALGTSVPFMIQSFLDLGVEILPITQPDVVVASTQPPHHLDPFDRMLVAQAQAHSLVIVTTDPDIPKYDVQILWR